MDTAELLLVLKWLDRMSEEQFVQVENRIAILRQLRDGVTPATIEKNQKLATAVTHAFSGLKKLIPLIAVFFLFACGTDESDKAGATDEPIAVKDDVVIMKGDKGDTGPIGPRGPRGDSGERGVDGSDGKDGKTIVEKLVPINQWTDPLTDRSWIIGANVTGSNATCGNGFVVPSVDEIEDAKAHGIGLAAAGLGAVRTVWSSDDSVNAGKKYFVDLDTVFVNDGGNADVHGLYCVEVQ